MTRIDLKIDQAKGRPFCLGMGLVTLDIVQGKLGDFAVLGGSCGNVMSILAWMGWRTAPAGRLGIDAAGNFVRRKLEETGVETDHLEQALRVATPIVIQKFVDSKDGDRSHRFSLSCPDCGGWLPRYRPMTLAQAKIVMGEAPPPKAYYFDRVSPASLKLAGWAREQGAMIVFEPPSIGDERSFQQAVDLCHILKYSHERLGHVPDLATVKAPKIVVETLGADGIRVRWRARWSHVRAFRAPHFVDAAGSGDWCSAGLIHKLARDGAAKFADLRKADLDRALEFGSALAAVNCGFESARGGMLALTLRQFEKALLALDDTIGSGGFEWRGVEQIGGSLPKELCDVCSGRSGERMIERTA